MSSARNEDIKPVSVEHSLARALQNGSMVVDHLHPSSAPPAARGELEILLRRVQLLWHRRNLILVIVVIFVLLGAFQVKQSTPLYEAVAAIKYQPAQHSMLSLTGRNVSVVSADEIETAVEILHSPMIAHKVLSTLQAASGSAASSSDSSPLSRIGSLLKRARRTLQGFLITPPTIGTAPEILSEQRQIAALLSQVSVRRLKGTQIVEVYAIDASPERGAQIANDFVAAFGEYLQTQQRVSFAMASEYLKNQISGTKQELASAEAELFQLSGRTDLSALNASREMGIQLVSSLTQQVESQRNKLHEERIVYEALTANLADGFSLEELEGLVDADSTLRTLIGRRNELILEKLKAETDSRPEYRPLSLLGAEIAGVEEQIRQRAIGFRQGMQRDLAIAEAYLLNLEERLSEQSGSYAAKEAELHGLLGPQREIEATRTILNSLLDQYRELDLAIDTESSSITVVSAASVPTSPKSPSATRTIFLFGLAGLFLSVGLILALDLADRTIHDPEQVEALMGLPFLGLLPNLSVGKGLLSLGRRRELSPVLAENSKSSQAEALRYIRTSLQYSRAGQTPKIILITSCLSSDGKTTLAGNLAVIMAETGGRTLLIDADMKRPMLHRLFAHSRLRGLSDVLTGQLSLAEAITQTAYANVDILTAGRSTPSPVSLLDSQAMSDLLREVRRTYSTVIVDSTPALGIADSMVLTKLVDGVVIVVRQGVTRHEILKQMTARLRQMDANLLGVVFNTRDVRRMAQYGYGYSYTYGRRYESYSADADDDAGTDTDRKEPTPLELRTEPTEGAHRVGVIGARDE